MRKRLLIILLCVSGALCLAAGSAVWWASRHMHTQEFRQELGRLIHSATGREASLAGEIKLSFFPWFGMRAQGFTLGNDPRFGETPLLRAREIAARIRVLPLFQRRLVFDTVDLAGAELVLTMDGTGRGNWEGLAERLGAQENATEEQDGFFRKITLRGVRVTDGAARLDDHEHNHSYIATGISLRTGRIESGQPLPFTASCDFKWPRPGLNARVEGTGKLHWSKADPEPLFTETSVQAQVGGVFMPKGAPTAALAANLSLTDGGRHLRLKDVRLKLVGADVAGELTFFDVTEHFKLEARLDLGPFTPSGVINAYWPGTIAGGHQGALHSARGPLNISADVNELVFESPGLSLDNATLRGRVRMGFDPPTGLDFDLSASQLDADALHAAFASNATAQPLLVEDLPLDYLRAVHGQGRLQAEHLKLAGVQCQGAELGWQAAGGLLKAWLKPAKAQGGTATGELSASFGQSAQARPGPQKQAAKGAVAAASAPAPAATAAPGQTVLGWSGAFRMEGVDARQVAWLNRPGTAVSGRLDLRAKAEAQKAPALPQARLSQVVRRAAAEVSASLGASTLEMTPQDKAAKGQERAQARVMNFSSVSAQARLASVPAGDADWAMSLDGGASAVGTKPLLNLDLKLAGLLKSRQGAQSLSGAFVSGRLKGWFLPKRENEAGFAAKGSLDFSSQALTLSAATVQACGLTLSGPMTGSQVLSANYTLIGRVRATEGDPKRVLAALDLRVPKSADKRALQRLSGEADLVLGAKGLSLSNINGQLDDMPLRGSYALQNFDAPRQTLALSGGNFDLDRYLPAPEPVRRGQPREKPAPEPLPVDLVRDLNMEANLALRSFKFKGLVTRDFKAGLSARGGNMLVKPLGGNFYGGTLSGEFSAQAQQGVLQTRLSLAFKDFQAGPAMEGWAGKEYVTGRADMFLDLGGAGATDQEVLHSLEGMAGFKITDGSYALSGASENGGQTAQPVQVGSRRTPAGATPQHQPTPVRRPGQPFGQASAKLKVQKGWFSSDDFRMDAPSMTVTGKGRFSPAEDQIAVNLTASMPSAPDVPIKVYGRLRDPEMEVSTGALIGNTIMSILGLPLKPIKFFKDLLF